MNKKGQLAKSYLLFGLIMAFVVIIGALMALVGFSFFLEISQVPEFQNPVLAPILAAMENSPLIFDLMVTATYFVIIFASLFFLYKIEIFDRTKYILSWFGLLLIGLVQIIVGYVLQQFTQAAAFSTVLTNMLFTPFYVEHSFTLGLIYVFISAIVLHIKR